jgi:hypothetical protein
MHLLETDLIKNECSELIINPPEDIKLPNKIDVDLDINILYRPNLFGEGYVHGELNFSGTKTAMRRFGLLLLGLSVIVSRENFKARNDIEKKHTVIFS